MRKFFVFLLMCFGTNVAFAQCEGGYCPSPPGRGYSNPYSGGDKYQPQPYSWQQDPTLDTRVGRDVLERIENASVIVYAEEGRGVRSKGSGTLIRIDDQICVITAGHVASGSSALSITSSKIQATRCELRKLTRIGFIMHTEYTVRNEPRIVNRLIDYAILEPAENQEELYQLAIPFSYNNVPPVGTTVVCAGYNRGETLRLWVSRIRRHLSVPNDNSKFREYSRWMELQYPAQQGDSGGGVFTKDGTFIGIIWGTNGQITLATMSTNVAWEFAEDTCLRWRRSKKPPVTPEQPKPNAPVPKPEVPEVKPEAPKVEPVPPGLIPKEEPTLAEKLHEYLYPTALVCTGYGCFVLTLILGFAIVNTKSQSQ